MIAEKLGYSRKLVSQLCAEYTRHKYGGNHRNMSIEEEKDILNSFEAMALSG